MPYVYDPGVPVTIERFREIKPAFSDADVYGDATVEFYLGLAWQSVNRVRWAQLFELGQILWTAHFLALEALDNAATEAGKPPGSVSGLTTSKSVGAVSIGYDMTTAAEEGAGHWNMTMYGRQWYRFSRMAGMGGIQIM